MLDTAFLKAYECPHCKEKNGTIPLSDRVQYAPEEVLICEKCTVLSKVKYGAKPKQVTEFQFKLLMWTNPAIMDFLEELRSKILKDQLGGPLKGFLNLIVAEFLKKHGEQ